MKKAICFIIVFLQTICFSGAGFYQDGVNNQYQKVVFTFSSGGPQEWKRADTEVNGVDYGSKSSSDYWHFLGGEGFVWKDNLSDITSVNLNYRIYKSGSVAGSYNSINLPFASNLGGNNQRWATTSADVDILNSSVINSAGTWYVEFYYSASTNGINCDNPIYFNNSGNNFKLSFTADNSLPVELSSFTALLSDKEINLNWKTATEVNNYGFNVERRTKSEEWNTIAFVNGSGNSNSPKEYSFQDKTVTGGNYIYRLKQIDNDGLYKYSPEVEVTVNNIIDGYFLEQNYPNPFNPNTSIKFGFNENTDVNLLVFDQIGNQVASLFKGNADAGRIYNVEFNAAGLASGIYFYKLEMPKKSEIRKMLLMK